MDSLPIDALAPELSEKAGGGVRNFVISAPTGSGKSTRLPPMLGGLCKGAVYVLQPRRIAARMLARRVAAENSMCLGKDVGWHIRFEKNYTPESKIVFLTEGILARKLLSESGLDGVGAVIFDEFHERNLYADTSLALALEYQKQRRPDLILAVCSASMDSSALLEYMGPETALLKTESRLFDIDISYRVPRRRESYWEDAADVFAEMASSSLDGNFLIFMPGIYEISRTIRAINSRPESRGFDVLPLYGELPAERQDAALAPSGRRKAIVCTNIAETSLTVDGVKFVIDSGYARIARYDSSRGVNTLLTERISLASALQRAGRAGRTSRGAAVRLWSKAEECNFDRFTAPEIKRLSLAQTDLWLRAAGRTLGSTRFLDSPDEDSVLSADILLKSLGAVDGKGNITPTGRRMARMPTEPRYAKLLYEGVRLGCLKEAAYAAALTETGRVKLDVDDAFRVRELDEMLGECPSELAELSKLCALAKEMRYDEDFCRKYGIHAVNARKVCSLAADFERSIPREEKDCVASEVGGDETLRWRNLSKCVLSAFPDHICSRVSKASYACNIAGGRRGEVRKASRRWTDGLFCAISLQEQNVSGRAVIMAGMVCPVEMSDIREMFPDKIGESDEVYFDESSKSVEARRTVEFMGLELSSERLRNPPESEAARILAERMASGECKLRNLDENVDNFISRVNFLSKYCPQLGYEFIDENFMLMVYEQAAFGLHSYAQVRDMDVLGALKDCIDPSRLASLDYYAPAAVQLPSRKRPTKLRYDIQNGKVVLSAWFKDLMLFDPSKIKIAEGRIPLTYEILAPNGRPVQTTQDLKNFWNTSWPQIAKELKARYPKHFKNLPDTPGAR